MGARLGVNAKLYVNTGSYDSPTWTEVAGISDLTVKTAWDQGEASTRASRVKKAAKTMLDLEVSGKILADGTDTNGYLAFLTALYGDTPLDLLVLNGANDASPASKGWRADWHVFGGDEDQGLGAVIYDSFTLKPALSSHGVYRASNTTFTAI